jgi:excisionase family DNA binding protein
MKPQELMTAKQVQAYVGCAYNTLKKAVREGRFPAPAQILGRQRWRKTDVDEYLEKAFSRSQSRRVGA